MLVALGYFGRRFITRLDKQDETLATQTLALGVLVSEHSTTADRARRAISKASELDRAHAVLKSRLDEHEKWSATEAQRARDDLAALRGR